MVEMTLEAVPALGGLDEEIRQNRILERHDLALTSIAVPLGGEAAFADKLKQHWTLDVPSPRISTSSNGIYAVSMTSDQIMLLQPGDGSDTERAVKEKLGGAGYTTNQTDAWVCLEVSGPQTLLALERICPTDLDLDVFPTGASARTHMEHLGALIIRLGAERFLLCSASSSAQSFADAIRQSYRNVMD